MKWENIDIFITGRNISDTDTNIVMFSYHSISVIAIETYCIAAAIDASNILVLYHSCQDTFTRLMIGYP